MKAISLWQPWASLIALGVKRVETRSWATSYRGLVAVHAAKRWTKAEREACDGIEAELQALARCAERPPGLGAGVVFVAELAAAPPLGAVVAVAKLAACEQMTTALIAFARDKNPEELVVGNWQPGRWAWVLEDVRPLVKPMPLRGRQGLWELSDDESATVFGSVVAPA